MSKIKLVDGTTINIVFMEVVNGVLRIVTSEKTVEELAQLFNDKDNVCNITMLSDDDEEIGYKTGFTSFSGIQYDADRNKTIELFQPVDITEIRISNAEGVANSASAVANSASAVASEANNKSLELEAQNAMLSATLDSILTDIIPNLTTN